MLFNARADEEYTIHLTYPIKHIDKSRKEDWEKEQGKDKKRKSKNVRPDWSPAKHGLRAFFDKHSGRGDKVSIVEEEEPHVIDLLDPLKF